MFNCQDREGKFYTNNIKSYRKKVEAYLKDNTDEIEIYKLRNNKRLRMENQKSLERVLCKEIGTKRNYEEKFKGE